ncbi:E3 ubiquitin-protein ligase TRIM41-like [Platysternon megacephalum]|uniref:E3 ubiquitin-protein ligase TRIM41-like n=1 Tax=Platysternon megacephalum TaxID=55544 RepID=A0A4D9DTU8_9SAUR|nr:E3 ubiquitin-protein ligase TRIM41-like [Platysternon megacephalum]
MWPGEGPELAEGPGEERNTPEPRWELRSECHAQQFFEAALELRGHGQLVDMTVMAGAQRYQAHGVVLAAVSAFFCQRLACGAAGEVDVDVSPLATPRGWEAVLDFAYTGAFTAMPGTAGELVAAAQALGAPRVVEICRRMRGGLEGPEGRSPDEEQWETLRGMEELYRAGVGCDLALTTEGETFRAHRVALSCGCEYFRAMFCSGMREARQGADPLPTLMAPADLRLLLPFAYSGTVAGSWAELLAAAETALQYQASGLLALCLEALQRALSPACSLDLLAFARAYDLRPLGTAAQAYALANFDGVAQCPGFPALPLAELLALLGSDELYVASEVEAFEAALRWLDADRTRRLPHAEAVLARVRFSLMGTRELRRVRAADLLAPPGRLYQLLVAAVADEGPCRVRTPAGALVICGGEGLAPSLATRRPTPELWFAHRFRSGVGLVKQVEWRRLGQFPDGPRFRHAAAVLGNMLYVLGGKHYYGDSWQRLADMPSARSSFPAVGVAGRIYALGGSSEDAYCTDGVQCYDPPADAWRPCSPLPAPLCGHAACTLDGAIYVSGGCDGSSECRAWLLRLGPGGPSAQLAPMLEERAGHIMEALGGRLYVAGGLRWHDGGYTDQLACEVYSPGPDAWVRLSPLPHAHVGGASAILQGELYVLGGYSQETYQDTHLVHAYQPGRGRWLMLGTLPQACADLRACVLLLPPALRGDPACLMPPHGTGQPLGPPHRMGTLPPTERGTPLSPTWDKARF